MPLLLPSVRQEVDGLNAGNSSNKAELKLKELERWNHHCCDLLTANGCCGMQLKMDAPVRKTTPAIMVANTKERIKAIRYAKSSGQMFYATGGQHLNSDDFFRARALAEREGQASSLKKKKALLIESIALDREANSLLQEKAFDLTVATEKNFRLPECKLLCKWKKCKLISTLTKPECVLAYVAAPRPAPPEPWTEEDENKLLAITSDEIDLKDTALGVAAKQMAAAVTQNMGKLDRNSRNLLLQSLAKFDSAENQVSPEGANHVI